MSVEPVLVEARVLELPLVHALNELDVTSMMAVLV
jgi:hypothetical protein